MIYTWDKYTSSLYYSFEMSHFSCMIFFNNIHSLTWLSLNGKTSLFFLNQSITFHFILFLGLIWSLIKFTLFIFYLIIVVSFLQIISSVFHNPSVYCPHMHCITFTLIHLPHAFIRSNIQASERFIYCNRKARIKAWNLIMVKSKCREKYIRPHVFMSTVTPWHHLSS